MKMDIKVKLRKGCFYNNEVWFSPAYQRLTLGARDLLQCLYTEIKKSKIKTKKATKKEWVFMNNAELSFTEKEYKELTGKCSATYLKSRNQLIEVGFIEQTHRGGTCRGDRAMYSVFFGDKTMPISKQRWRRYPQENWADEIPKAKKQLVGVNTQFKKGKSARKLKPTL